ncbi:TetR/AcrR family transcriptional regulator [Nostoc sp. CHAB 5834]|nr:TetR/AcrR family transcriptional regulator [Nostoc sp. CHAB 5834]
MNQKEFKIGVRSLFTHSTAGVEINIPFAEVGYENMSIEAIASRAGVGKTTIYRRYTCKEELVADAIESLRDDLVIPDTGRFWGDMDILINNAAKQIDSPLGRQTLALIIRHLQKLIMRYLKPLS